MNKVLRMLTVLSLLVCFGFSEEVASETPAITVSGELSSDIVYNSDAESAISFCSILKTILSGVAFLNLLFI